MSTPPDWLPYTREWDLWSRCVKSKCGFWQARVIGRPPDGQYRILLFRLTDGCWKPQGVLPYRPQDLFAHVPDYANYPPYEGPVTGFPDAPPDNERRP